MFPGLDLYDTDPAPLPITADKRLDHMLYPPDAVEYLNESKDLECLTYPHDT